MSDGRQVPAASIYRSAVKYYSLGTPLLANEGIATSFHLMVSRGNVSL